MTSTLLLLAGLLAPSARAADVLYCRDVAFGLDSMEAALDSSGLSYTLTTALSTTCETEIADGAYSLVVVAAQNVVPAMPALEARIALGLPTIYQSSASPIPTALGALRMDTNLLTVSNIDAVLSTGLSGSSLGLDNPGWGIFSYSMAVGAGLTALADFEDGNAAVVLAGSSVIINGFLVDTSDSSSEADMEQLYLNEIFFLIDGGVDADGDGYLDAAYGGDDCDDADASINPGAADDWYDGLDANCDGASDYDADGDGYDSADFGGSDCDDTDFEVNPAWPEFYYDGIDSNCDGLSDYDQDGDGQDSSAYGGDDCDDTSATTYAGAPESWYDGVDQACDGGDDYDQDGDGYAYDGAGGDDCDDTDSSVNPAASETYYDGVDADCDGGNDYDADGDGYGSDVYGGTDCDDADADVNPDAEEVIDGIDNDCNGFDETYDQDGDGLTNLYEEQIGLDPTDDDTDADGMNDGDEVDYGTDGLDKDSDDDGLSDGAEWNVYFCDPLIQDTDGDGVGDATEVGRDYDTVDTIPGYFIPDADTDTRTNPNDADTDDDGIADGLEDLDFNGAQQLAETDAASFDSDGDLVSDGTEIGLATATSLDTDLGEFVADSDPGTTTDPLVADTDGGGVNEGGEDFNVDGRVDSGECDPNDATDDENCIDSDGDGLPDAREVELGTDPNDPDSDNDGLSDGIEVLLSETDPLNVDTDGDGLADGAEDADLDGTFDVNETDPNDADTDDGGVNDGDEVLLDGTDPLDPSDDIVEDDDTGVVDDTGGEPAETTYVYAGRGCDSAAGAPAVAALGTALLALAGRRRRN